MTTKTEMDSFVNIRRRPKVYGKVVSDFRTPLYMNKCVVFLLIYIYICICMYVCVYIYMYVCVCVCVCVSVCVSVCVCVCVGL